MATITVIPARKRYGSASDSKAEPDLRVAAYCRVSTDSDEQATSYEAQIEHYTTYIKAHPGWAFAGCYADDGISGTNTLKRDEFNRLIADCMDGKIDMVVTKSISRFARNTLDCLKYIRQLKERNIAVFFEKESINTLDTKGEVLLTIMASLAQQESQSLSQNVRLGLQYRYQQGKVQVCTTRFLGYDKDENGNLIINPDEAIIVKRIFREYLEGSSYYEIGNGLSRDGIKTAAGNLKWQSSTLQRILTNEKYMGDAPLQKTVTVDFLTKKRVANKGLVPQYYVQNSHEAIIPREIFMRVQEEMERRKSLVTPSGKKRTYNGLFALTNVVYCGICNEPFRRVHWNNRGKKSTVWRCSSKLNKSTSNECRAHTVHENVIQQVVIKAINDFFEEKDSIISVLKTNIETVLATSRKASVKDVECRIQELQKALVERASNKQSYDDIADQIDEAREQKRQLLLQNAKAENDISRLADIERFIDEQGEGLTKYDDSLVRRFIDIILVFDNYFLVRLKTGAEIEVTKQSLN